MAPWPAGHSRAAPRGWRPRPSKASLLRSGCGPGSRSYRFSRPLPGAEFQRLGGGGAAVKPGAQGGNSGSTHCSPPGREHFRSGDRCPVAARRRTLDQAGGRDDKTGKPAQPCKLQTHLHRRMRHYINTLFRRRAEPSCTKCRPPCRGRVHLSKAPESTLNGRPEARGLGPVTLPAGFLSAAGALAHRRVSGACAGTAGADAGAGTECKGWGTAWRRADQASPASSRNARQSRTKGCGLVFPGLLAAACISSTRLAFAVFALVDDGDRLGNLLHPRPCSSLGSLISPIRRPSRGRMASTTSVIVAPASSSCGFR